MRIIVLEGDETGQELLEQSLRVLDPGVLQLDLDLERYDLSLAKRRETGNAIVEEAAAAMRDSGYGLKAATVTPEGRDDVGSPNRLVREGVGGKVIVRTGRRIPGVVGPVSGVFIFFLTDLGVMPWMPSGRTNAHAITNPDSSSTANKVFSIGESRETPRKSAWDATARTNSSENPWLRSSSKAIRGCPVSRSG